MITIAIANQKGGVGKTTLSFNLAHSLTRIARRIKDEEAINCIDSGVPELVEWGKQRLSISWTKEEK